MIEIVYGRHTFPHKRIRRDVRVARDPYECDTTLREPAGHVRAIGPGDQYVRVSMLPTKKKSDPHRHGWSKARLCAACAVNFGLARVVGS